MSLTEAKAQIVEKYQRSAGDTGSSEVQVALISSRITNLTEHMKVHKKDLHTRLGLMKLVAKRRKLLNYLKRTETSKYKQLIEQLDLRR